MKKNKPARWEFLDELDGRTVDDTPIRDHTRKPDVCETVLYAMAGILWFAALLIAVTGKDGKTGLLLLGGFVLSLRYAVYELKRRARCRGSLLGTVESFTRRRLIRRNARYPVIRFEVDGTAYRTHGAKPSHPSTQGNEEWVSYNPQDPADSFAASDSKPTAAILLTALSGFLGVALLILELN